jgi:hypothetical protein
LAGLGSNLSAYALAGGHVLDDDLTASNALSRFAFLRARLYFLHFDYNALIRQLNFIVRTAFV